MKTQILTIVLLMLAVFGKAQRIYTVTSYPQISYLDGAVAVDPNGNIFIADYQNNKIVKIDAGTGVQTTVAGTGINGYNGDGIPATSAQLYGPITVALDTSGNIYIADYSNNRIRKVDISTGLISTLAGNGSWGYNGDNISAISAIITNPTGIAVDNVGNIYFADLGNNRIRKIDITSGLIHTIAGTGIDGYNGDEIPANTAELNFPYGIAIDNTGNVFVADKENQRIRKIDVSTGFIHTIAGNGTVTFNGDNISAVTSSIYSPKSVAVDNAGNIYIADSDHNRIRKVDTAGIIFTVAGNGTSGYNGDGGYAMNAQLSSPRGVAVDLCGNIYISDYYNRAVRKVTSYDAFVTFTDALCPETCNGTLNAFASGGIAPYSFLWSGGVGMGANHTNICAGNYTVTITDNSGCFETISATILEPDSFTVFITSVNATCLGNGSASATVYGGQSPFIFLWSNDSVTSHISGLSSGVYNLTVTDTNNCVAYRSVTIINNPVPFPSVPICLVSVDSISQHNIIIWDKASFTNIDSFIVCREISTNNYQPIARIPFDSLSMFVDTVRTLYFPNTGNPNSGTFRYKIQMSDSCGNLSQFSSYHNTIFMLNNGSGIFYWTQPYSIENGPNPVTSYILMRDDLSNGNWQAVSSVTGTQQTVTDPLYVIYQNTASWRVKTEWNVSCTPTLKGIMSSSTSYSNIYTNNLTTIKEKYFSNQVFAYPNPTDGLLTINSSQLKIQSFEIFNIFGESVFLVKNNNNENSTIIDISYLKKGLYFLSLKTSESVILKKIIKE